MPKQLRKSGRRRRPRMRRNNIDIIPIPRGPINSLRTVLKYVFNINSGSTGVIDLSLSLGSEFTGLSDFTALASVFTRFTIIRATVVVSPIRFASTVVSTPMAVGYVNDGIVATPSTAEEVLSLSGAKIFNSNSSSTQGCKLTCNPKPALDPWTPTASQTAAQLLQFGGYQFYGSGSTASTTLWTGYLTAELAFIGKI
jgi:hypothetical protein